MFEVKKIWISPSVQKIEGLLFKILFKDKTLGYNSLHPLSNFGEGILSNYISLLKDLSFLKKKNLSYQENLLKLCFEGAYLDGTYRNKKQSLLSGFSPLKNHKLIFNIEDHQSFDGFKNSIFKIKMGKNILKETLHLRKIIQNTKQEFKIRLDFNAQLSLPEWNQWRKENQDLKPFIDFIEDPSSPLFLCDFPVASDWEFLFFSPIKIIKPTRIHFNELNKKIAQGNFKRIIFTNTLTHPLEARLSYVLAQKFYQIHPNKKEVCGLDYPLNNSTSFLNQDGFDSSYGTGLGFDSILEKQKWIYL